MRLDLKNIITLAIFIGIVFSCTEEEELVNFKTAFRNESGEQILIVGYNLDNEVEYTYDLSNNETSPFCEIPSPVFLGADCAADSIVISFQGNKGFICSTRFNNSENLCFPDDKSPIGGGDAGDEVFYREISPNTFEFIITELDSENAFELPE